MLRTLKDLFDSLLPPSPAAPAADGEHALQLATAVLLVEVMRSAPEVGADERRAVVDALRATFALGADEIERLIELAEQTARDASDYFRFTSRINEGFDMAQKVRMIELMWRVAYADGKLGAHEQHVLWRIADLLHVPHGAYVNAKMRARDAMGAGAPPDADG
ncbi:MAG: TerB family tellurite resistance protein [Rubrivivax sp.]|nr:TerB family tellurite resistance protein [Rubrivivax sp.]